MSAVHSEASPAQVMLQLLEQSGSLLGPVWAALTPHCEMLHGALLVSEVLM